MPLLLLAGSMFGVLNIAAAAKSRCAKADQNELKLLPSPEALPSPSNARSIGGLLAAAL